MFQTSGSRGIPQRVGFNRSNPNPYAFRYTDPYNNKSIQLLDNLAELCSSENMFMNPGMQIDQVYCGNSNPGYSSANGNYAIDGILVTIQNSTAILSAQQVTDAPPGYTHSVKFSITTADAAVGATDLVCFQMGIEGNIMSRMLWGTTNAQPISIGFWIKANRPGQYGGGLLGNGNSRNYPFAFSINQAATWEYKTLVVPGDTGGTWTQTNSGGLFFTITMMAGSSQVASQQGAWIGTAGTSVTGQINGVAATTDFIQITGIMAVKGNIPIPQARAPYLMPRFYDALQFCQRYYEKSYDLETKPATITSTGAENYASNWVTGVTFGQRIFAIRFKVAKCTSNPTMTAYSPNTGASGKARDATNNADCTANWGSTVGEQYAPLQSVETAVSSTGFNTTVHWTADARL